MIYVIVKVTYDYFRFQENQGAYTNLDQAIARAKFLQERSTWNMPKRIYRYGWGQNPTRAKLDKNETAHYWIQRFQTNHEK